MSAKKIPIKTGEQKKIEVKADESPELVAVFNPWQRVKQAAEKAKNTKPKEEWRWLVIISCLIALMLLIGGGIEGYRLLTRPVSPLSPEISSSLPFSPYVIPKGNKNYYTYNYRYTSAEGQGKILSFNIQTPEGITLTLSEYAEPAQFSSIPNYQQQFLSSVAQQYSSVSTPNGTIYLGRTTKADNKQLGLIIDHGVLVLMAPSSDMTNAQWHDLGKQFIVQ